MSRGTLALNRINLNLTFNNPTKTLLILANFESTITRAKDDVVLDYTT